MEANSSDLSVNTVDALKWNAALPVTEQGWCPHPSSSQPSCASPDTAKRKFIDSPRANVIGAEPMVERHEESRSIRSLKSTADQISLSALLDPLATSGITSSVSQPNLEDDPAHYQRSSESLFGLSLSRSLDKQPSNASHRSSATEKHLSAGPNVTVSSLWDQRSNLWSKSTPQQLQGLESFSSSLAHVLPNFITSDFTEPGKSTNASDHPASVLDALGADGCFNPSNPLATLRSGMDEERRLHCPDGADQPDEHLWLYEDPQGRTQGSFSDVQMNNWLSAGIYFTPVLRIRRKCDTAFSTLEDYSRLFGRTPFTPGPRVPPIRGGITPAMINASNKLHQGISAPALFLDTQSTSACQSMNSTVTNPMLTPRTCHNATGALDFSPAMVRSGNPMSGSEDNPHPGVKTVSSNLCANSSLSVLPSAHQAAQLSTLTNALSALNMTAQPPANQDSQSITSASTFMALASLISVNPALASLAMSFSGQTQANSHMDFATAALAPGFLTALAQYLNVQPQLSGHQTVSPMQQLAETAQLAAQLAAMAGTHSPIEPAQALALAELVRSQAQSTPASQWLTHTKKEAPACSAACGDSAQHEASVDATMGKMRLEDHTLRPATDNAVLAGTHGSVFDDDNRLDSQSQWPMLSSSSGSGNRAPSRPGDRRRLSSKGCHSSPFGDYYTGPLEEHTADGAITSGGHSVPSNRRHVNSQSSAHTQPIGSRNGTTKASSVNGMNPLTTSRTGCYLNSEDGAWLAEPNDPHSSLNHQNDLLPNSGSALGTVNYQASGNVQWVNKAKQKVNKSTAQPNRATSDTTSATSVSSVGKTTRPATCQTKTGVDQTKANSKSAATTRSPLKASGGSQATAVCEIKSVTGTSDNPDSPCTLTESGRTAEEELQRLTQWCQTRLSQLPMREKVDIPTVVELLATLDAPYEVETMVQTFLGESSRTSLFVKDFLDQRRPFWQLHRERRECEALKNCSTKSTGTPSNGSVPRSVDKKKRSGNGLDNVLSPTSPNSGSGWTKVRSTQTALSDQSQDNQWHHIKPKGSHNRKGKKDKAS